MGEEHHEPAEDSGLPVRGFSRRQALKLGALGAAGAALATVLPGRAGAAGAKKGTVNICQTAPPTASCCSGTWTWCRDSCICATIYYGKTVHAIPIQTTCVYPYEFCEDLHKCYNGMRDCRGVFVNGYSTVCIQDSCCGVPVCLPYCAQGANFTKPTKPKNGGGEGTLAFCDD